MNNRPARWLSGQRLHRCFDLFRLVVSRFAFSDSSIQADHTVRPAVTVIHHARLVRFLVDEEEEWVTNQFHLVERLIHTHRLSFMDFLPDNDGRITQLFFTGLTRLEVVRALQFGTRRGGWLCLGFKFGFKGARIELLMRVWLVMAPMIFRAVARTTQPFKELSRCDINCRITVR